jgi:hypothetical protein
MRVTDIQQLIDWQISHDVEVVAAVVDSVERAHPGTGIIEGTITDEKPHGVQCGKDDLSCWPEGVDRLVTTPDGKLRPVPFPRPQKILGSKPRDVGKCADCNEPMFMVIDVRDGETVARCRGVINAILRQSLQHHQYTEEICWDCELTTDSIGLISGCNHHPKPFLDQVVQEEVSHFATRADVAAALEVQIAKEAHDAKEAGQAFGVDAVVPALTLGDKVVDQELLIRPGLQPLIDAGRLDLTDNVLSISES